MVCPDENTMTAYFELRLPPEEAARVEQHLSGCSTCRRVLVEYSAMATERGGVSFAVADPASSVSPPPDLADKMELGRRVAHAQAKKRVGTVLCEKWRIERLIGIGGMAQVFAATHRNGRNLAVKVLRPELAVEPAFVERFLREGYVANKVRHPGAVAILDDDMTPDGTPFLVMELLTGRTLGQRLRDSGPLGMDDALRITGQVLDVLASAHDRGIVHRDIKPDNLFETDGGGIKVLDFGIARLREALGTSIQTQSGLAMGTIGYMPPEQARGEVDGVESRSDIWATGATLFTLLTGQVVHDARTPNESLLLAMTAPVPPTATRLGTLPVALSRLLDKALAFDKNERFVSCRAMQDAVQGARTAAVPVRASFATHAKRAALVLGAGAVIVASSIAATKTAKIPEGSQSVNANVDQGGPAPSPPSPAAPVVATSEEGMASPADVHAIAVVEASVDAGGSIVKNPGAGRVRPTPPRAPVASATAPPPAPSVFNPLLSRH